jgi:hypothetical protein
MYVQQQYYELYCAKFVRNLQHVHMYVDTFTTVKHVHIYIYIQKCSMLAHLLSMQSHSDCLQPKPLGLSL